MITIKPFGQLTPHELYAILRLRVAVFIVEQQCIFQDIDSVDPHCHHVMISDATDLRAYTRLVPPGVTFSEMSIGRVVSSKEARSTGEGKKVMAASIEACYKLFGQGPIKIGAQLYLKKFYGSFGFIQDSAVYLEDGIEHIHMIRK